MEEKRNIQIRERAGLEESRLNQDFIDFLTKWSTPLLVVVALFVGGQYFYKQYNQKQEARLTAAFEQLSKVATVANPSPDSLRQVATEFAGVGSVGEMARLKAGDAYMRAVLRGVKPGADVNPDGTVKEVGDELTAEDRESFLTQAEEQYRLVVESTVSDPKKAMLRVGGLFGLASVAESRGDSEKAKSAYEQIKSIAAGSSELKHFVDVAGKRIESLPSVIAVAKLPTKASLPAPFKEDAKPQGLTVPTIDAPGSSSITGPTVPQPEGPAAPAVPPTDKPADKPAEKPVEPAQPK
ncbi:MAG: hypothetical protein K2Y21_15705 [Phycisphaerales bacterium]|nr:hypothetical protein [Phycisphaerales bacterium]